jgi:hypothetical protein
MGAQLSGPITVLLDTGDVTSAEIVRYDSDGKQLWSQTDAHALLGLWVEPNAGMLYASGPDRDEASAPSNAYVLNPDGSGERELAQGGGLDCGAGASGDAQGDLIIGHTCPYSELVEVTPADGATWSISSDDGIMVERIAFDADRNVVLAGKASRATTLRGQPIAAGLLIAKLSRDGHVQWVQQLSGDGYFDAVGTSAKGTVVVLASLNQSVSWGSQSIAPGVVLLTAEANGTPRWARALAGEVDGSKTLAVDPEGQVAIATTDSCQGATVLKYNLAGDFLWKRRFSPKECDSSHYLELNGLAIVGHDVVLGGNFQGTVDFGSGAQSSAGNQGFLMKLSQ